MVDPGQIGTQSGTSSTLADAPIRVSPAGLAYVNRILPFVGGRAEAPFRNIFEVQGRFLASPIVPKRERPGVFVCAHSVKLGVHSNECFGTDLNGVIPEFFYKTEIPLPPVASCTASCPGPKHKHPKRQTSSEPEHHEHTKTYR